MAALLPDRQSLNEALTNLADREKTKDVMVEEFKAVYKSTTASDYEKQIPYLSQLADYYSARDNWPSLVRAHSLYVSCDKREDNSKWGEQAYQMKRKYWTRNVQNHPPGFAEQQETIASLKKLLIDIREKYMGRLEKLGGLFVELPEDIDTLKSRDKVKLYEGVLESVTHVSRQLKTDMVTFTGRVAEEAIAICGEPPCEFSVVGLGSLARGETTPYSDLEFMFLVERKTRQIEKYFEVLAVTMYFLIGDLAETKLKYMAIHELMSWDAAKQKYTGHWFNDTTVNGFKIDGLGIWAGNIPTGSDSDKQTNRYICTVDEISDRYKQVFDNPDPVEALTGDLTAMLASTVHVYGCQKLHDGLRKNLNAHKANERRTSVNRKMLERDVNRFDFKPDNRLTHKHDIKFDVYRYPSLLVLDLKILHGFECSDPWEVIGELLSKAVISSAAADALRFVLCCAVYSRLATYFHYRSQSEQVSVLTSSDESEDAGLWQIPRPLLVHMFLHMVPLKEAVSQHLSCSTSPIDIVENEESMVRTAALVYYCCQEYKTTLSVLRHFRGDGTTLPADDVIQFAFIHSLVEQADYSEAEERLFNRIRDGQMDANACHLLALLYERQSQFDKALQYHKQSLDLQIAEHDSTEHADIASAYTNLGVVYYNQGNLSQALEWHTTALEMKKRIHGEKDNTSVAASYNNLGLVHDSLCNYGQAVECYKNALDMRLRIFGDRDHISIARSYNNIGHAYDRQDDHNQALKYFEKSLDIKRRLFDGRDHADIATAYANLGLVHKNQGNYDQALECHGKAIAMRLRIFGENDDADLATSYNNMGLVYYACGAYTQALDYFMKALDMRRRIFGDRDHFDIATTCSNVGLAYDSQRDHAEAVAYYTMALEMLLRIFGDKAHTSVATTCLNMGLSYSRKGDYIQALEYHQKALGVWLKIHGDVDHTTIATSYNNIGFVYSRQSNYSKALHYFMKSLDMRQRLFGGRDHSSIAQSYNNVGYAYCSLGDRGKALEYGSKGLDMMKRIFPNGSHPEIATVSRNLQALQSEMSSQ